MYSCDQLFILLETETKKYSYGYDIISTLKHTIMPPNSRITVLWDCEKFDKCILATKINNDITIINVNKNYFHSEVILNAFQSLNGKRTFVNIYCHGNGWYYRHQDRIYSIAQLFSLVNLNKIKVDVLALESCYLSTIECMYELRDIANYIIVSEYTHSKIGSSTFLFLEENDTNEIIIDKCKYYIDSHISRINNAYISDFTKDLDYAIINTKALPDLITFLQKYHVIKNIPRSLIQNFKVHNEFNYCYDLYSTCKSMMKQSEFETFIPVFNSTVLYWKTNKRNNKNLHGIAFCPYPEDSKHAWTFKYLQYYKDLNFDFTRNEDNEKIIPPLIKF